MMIGFTGPREGLTPIQHRRLHVVTHKLSLTAFIHGGSYGADTLAHYAVRWNHRRLPIFILPADRDNGTIVTYPLDPDINIILQPREPLERNDIIIKVVDGLIAAPRTMKADEDMVRKARKSGVPILFIWPNGTASIERNN